MMGRFTQKKTGTVLDRELGHHPGWIAPECRFFRFGRASPMSSSRGVLVASYLLLEKVQETKSRTGPIHGRLRLVGPSQ
jgi:hypothetical protein